MTSASQRWRSLMAAAAVICGPVAQAREFPAWMRVDAPRTPPAAFGAFREFIQASPGKGAAKWFERGSESTYLAGGKSREEWHFFAQPGASLPSSAYHLSEPSRPPYRVVVQPYCTGGACSAIFEAIAKIRAPRPTGSAARPLLREWRAIVSDEPCDPVRPVRIRSPRATIPGVRQGLDGVVRVKAFHNRCGEVRDAEVDRSSGDERLDRMAVMIVLGWRLAPRPANSSGWSIQTVRFDLVPPRPATDALVKPARR